MAAQGLQVRLRCIWLQATGVLGRGGRGGAWGQMGPKMVANWEREKKKMSMSTEGAAGKRWAEPRKRGL